MGAELHSSEFPDGLAKVRAQLLTALHLGRLKPGDRIPSVRRMASLTGLNRKTVHRAYLKLASEGFLHSRQGSGTFLADDSRGPSTLRPAPRRLLDAIHRCRDEAQGIGLSADQFARYVSLFSAQGLKGATLAIVECNREQIGLIGHEIAQELGCTIRPVLLHDVVTRPQAAIGDAQAVVTTDCHRQDVVDACASLELAVFRVALDPAFPNQLIQRAKQGPVVMVVRDTGFEPPWRRLLRQLKVTADVADQFMFVEPRGLLGLLRTLRQRPAIYVSPLVEAEVSPGLFDRSLCVAPMRYTEGASLERLKALALFDLVSSEGSAGESSSTPRNLGLAGA